MQWLVDRFREAPEAVAFVHRGRRIAYGEVAATVDRHAALLDERGVAPGALVAVVSDYSPETFCFILALALRRATVIPLSRESVVERDVALAICGCDWLAEFDAEGREVTVGPHVLPVENPMMVEFRTRDRAGLLLFSSGSTGTPKAILHDFEQTADKFRIARKPTVAIAFLMIDHFGGINTLLAITASLGTVVTVAERTADQICQAIVEHRVQLLPTTPSFLTMLMASGLHRTYDLSSLERISYGTEVMPQATLDRVREAFPNVVLQQTYGLSEVGVLRSVSRPDGSLWVRIGGDGFETKVVDDILYIRSRFAMVGYLNAPPAFDADGWFNTQDKVEVDGEYFRILGRVTDIINVGGQKVYPSEVEDVILEMDNVADVAVIGEPHALLGQLVTAKVVTVEPEPIADLKKRVRAWCAERLTNYKVPSKVVLAEGNLYSGRQKKVRKATAAPQ